MQTREKPPGAQGPARHPWWMAAQPPRAVDRAAVLLGAGGPRTTGPLRALHLNESPYPPSPRAIDAARTAAATMNRYPDGGSRALVAALARRTGVVATRIVCGHGSEELIQALCTLGAASGGEVVTPAPSFPYIAMAAAQRGARPVRAPLDANGASDAHALLAAVTASTRVIFCCTPNPPSGGMMTGAAVEHLVRGAPADVLLVMDEAYHEFGRHAGGPDILSALAARQGPWVVLRTFSKAYGLAGARVGYALCSAESIADALCSVKTTYGPSGVALAAALAALEDDAYLTRTLDAVEHERERMTSGLASLGLRPFPTAANFVSVALPMPAARAMAGLLERGILVRDWRDAAFQDEIRVTVGRPEDTVAFLDAIREILAAAAASGEVTPGAVSSA